MADPFNGFEPPCRQTDPEVFFPEGPGPQRAILAVEAQKICWRGCPLWAREICKSMRKPTDDGVWGGEFFPPRKHSKKAEEQRVGQETAA
jgi:hypothetical protein